MVDRLAQTAQLAIVLVVRVCVPVGVSSTASRMLADPRRDDMLVGYQAEGTLGRQTQRFGPRGGRVKLDGQHYDIRAQVA